MVPAQILIIEDNDMNRGLMAYLLQAFGHITFEAKDGVAGLETARRQTCDLILSDVFLPKLDGFGIVKELKKDKMLRTIPVVAITALARVGDRDRIMAAGFDAYISKPITPETFVQDIEKFLPLDKRGRVARSVPATPASTDVKSSLVVNERATILVVDDTVANIEFARSTLEPSGYRLLTANGVQEAIELAKASTPDLILCDLSMVPQSGLDLLKIAKTDLLLKGIPFVITSSTYLGEGQRQESLRLGAADFVERPIEPEALLATIERNLDKAKSREYTGADANGT